MPQSHRRSRHRLATLAAFCFGLTIIALTTATTGVDAQTFTPGDVFLQARGSGATGTLIQHVNLATGAITDFATIPASSVDNRSMGYDRVRDRLYALSNGGILHEIDADGNVTSYEIDVPYYTFDPSRIAGTGDGRLYMFQNESRLVLHDECNGSYNVSDVYGDGPWFHRPEGFTVSGPSLYYHPPTHEIFIGATRNSGYASASSFIGRYQLDPHGLAVTGESTEINVQVGGGLEAVFDLGPGPDEQLFVAIGGAVDNVYTVDPEMLELTLYSSLGGGGNLRTAAYHPGLDRALTVQEISSQPTELRSYAAGSSSDHIVIAEGLAAGTIDIVVIGSDVIPGPMTGVGSPDCNGNGVPDLCDIADGSEGDCDENGIPDSCDIADGDLPDLDGTGIADDCDAPTVYTEGWLYSINGNTNPTLYRIHPESRDPEPWIVLADIDASAFTFTYDPWRQSLLLPHSSADRLLAIAIDGSVSDIDLTGYPFSNVSEVATTGDGRLYVTGGVPRIARVSACGQVDDLLDESGTAPFEWSGGTEQLFFHEPTSSLIIIHGGWGPNMATRLPLDAEGRRVIGPAETIELFPSSASLDSKAISRGPDDTVMVFFDANGGPPRPQILTIHVETMTWGPFATFQYSTLTCGSYSTLTGNAYSNYDRTSYPDEIREFTPGTMEFGTIWTTGLPVFKQLLVIGETLVGNPPSPPEFVDCNGNGVNDYCDLETGASEDCNGNDRPDECDLDDGIAVDTNGNGVPDVCDPQFVRGDADGDGVVEITDAVLLLAYLFQDGDVPCIEAVDIDDDQAVLINDAINLLNFMFASGASPQAPFPACGIDPLGDSALGCGEVSGCL